LASEPSPENQLHITFVGSFSGEKLELYSSDKKVYESAMRPLPTGTSGYTEILVISTAHLKIRVPELNLTKSVDVNLKDGKFLYVSLEKNQLSFQQETKSRGYE
jgi:hypothetical protein